jgi:hypothetical protein
LLFRKDPFVKSMAQYLDGNGALQPVLVQEVLVRFLADGGTTRDTDTILANGHFDEKNVFVFKKIAKIIW